ncbi:beta strand repeat-containing protein [Neisseria meningitidis]|uniref:beta strand repeat-containing protein n=6 Tax=Neisseria meningitidis TaxID=487 RepID=UPI0012908185|nr:S-layer family protein [Neisseria meningitidis]
MLKTPPMLAAELSGKTGVSISAPYANENSRIILSAADIAAENGKIKLQSYGDQSYYAGQGELYTLERRSYKTGKWYNRKHITEVKEHKNAKPDAVNLSASQGIDIKSGGSIDAYATVFDAPKGSINIEAGRKLTLYAVEELNYDKLDSHKKRKFLGITYDKVHDTSTQQMQTALPSRVVAESANLQSGWDTKLQGTQFETTLGGAVIRAGVGDQARADAKIILEGIKSSIHTETVSSSKSALWQKQAGRGSNIETLQLPSFTGPVAPVLSAPGGYIVDIPKGNLKTEIEKLAKQPEYAYLKQLQVAKNINWNQVQLAYDKWDYKQEGLTGAGAAIIALAVTVVTSGAGTGAVLGLNGAAAAATDAAFASLASQASVSFINNKGDVGKTLKELGRSSTVKNLVVAAATAGVADKIGASALNNVSDKQWINNLTVNLANAGSAALINTAINGGSLKDNLGDAALGAIVSTVHGEVASKIKFNLSEDYITHKIAHAIAGCAAAAANKGKCQDGAIGAAVGEIVGEALTNGKNPATLTAKEREQILAYSKLVAGTVSGVVGGDVNAAANAAEVAVKNNQLSDKEGREFDNEMTACAKQNNPQLCRKNTVKKYQNVADKRLAASIAICTDISRSTECRTIRKQHLIDSRSLHSSWEAGLIGKDDEWYKLFSKSYTQADLALQSYHLNTAAKSWLQSGNTKPLSEWMSDQGYTLISGVNPRFIPIPRGFVKQNTPITNVKYPEGISFDTNLKRHLANADGFSQKQGIKGAHNRTNFMAELNSRGGRVKSETQTDIEGITRIKYGIPTLDRTGKPDGGFKEISSIKTVYDPKKFSDDKILQMAQNAASQGYSTASKIAQNERTKSISERKNVIQFSETFDGIKFRSYFDVNKGRITNIHPE